MLFKMLVLALAGESLLDLVFSSDSNLIQNVSVGPGERIFVRPSV